MHRGLRVAASLGNFLTVRDKRECFSSRILTGLLGVTTRSQRKRAKTEMLLIDYTETGVRPTVVQFTAVVERILRSLKLSREITQFCPIFRE